MSLDVSLAEQRDQLVCILEALITTTILARANTGPGPGARLWGQAAGGLIPVLPCTSDVTLSEQYDLCASELQGCWAV